MTLDAIPFLALDLALLAFGFLRPWHALVALLGLLPLNGAFTQPIPVALGLSPIARVFVGGWHDALLLGIVAAAGWRLVRGPDRHLTLIEWLIAGMLALGTLYVAISPFLLTAAYAYRVLYEPPLLLAAITVLARQQGMPAWVPTRGAIAFILTTVAGAVFTWPQVYLLRYRFLQIYYTDPGKQIHHSYLAHGINQPRGIGLENSPNEWGAVLAIAILLLLVPRLLPIATRWRPWLLGALTLALVLSFSRSAILAALVGFIVVLVAGRANLPRPRAAWQAMRSRVGLLSGVPATAIWLALLVAIVTTSGAPTLVTETLTGAEPSAGGRVDSAVAGLKVLKDNPFGLGLGTAGPKAARFGETAGQPRILTETWYVLYAIQVGVIGLALLAATGLAILFRLWKSRDGPWSQLVLALGIGLGVGAIFIPIIEEPTIYTPLWAFTGLALAGAAAARRVGADGVGADGVAAASADGQAPEGEPASA